MSVSDPYQIGCDQILTEVYLYLDLECSDDRRTLIQTHLDQCRDCLRQFGIEHEVKLLVARCCGSDRAPQEFRERLRSKIAALVQTQASREPG